MAKKPSQFQVSVQITPVSGKATEKKVMVRASATVREVMEAAGLSKSDLEKKNFSVDGKPAKLDDRVTSLSKVAAEPQVKVTERPRGS